MASLSDSSQPPVELRGKTVLVTGASSGIGRAVVRALAREGCRLILTARSQPALQDLAAEIEQRDTVIPADLTSAEDIARLCDQAISRFRRIDILINSAGVGLYAPSHNSPPELVRRMFELNVLAPVEITRRLMPAMGRGSVIVNISSIAGKVALPWMTLYSASKFALNAFSNGLRMELAGTGIGVLCVCPGYVDTAFRENVLVGRIPEEVAGQRYFRITAEQCAAEIVEGLRKNKRTVVTPRIGWLLAAMERLFPRLIHGRMARMREGAQAPAGDAR
jgi:short-subunit dehydrogenase